MGIRRPSVPTDWWQVPVLSLFISTLPLAVACCQTSNALLQQQRMAAEAQQLALQQAQQRAQQAQQEAQQRAQQQAQQEAQQRAQQEAHQAIPQHAPVARVAAPNAGSASSSRGPIESHSSTAVAPAPSRDERAVMDTRPTAPAARAGIPILLNASTKAIVRPGSSTLTIKHVRADGSRVVMNSRYADGKTSLASAYVAKRDSAGGLTKTFLDGHKLIYSRDGEITRRSANGFTETIGKSGLRRAALGDGRVVFSEHWEHLPNGTGTRSDEIVVRTEYATVVAGRPVFHPAPVIRQFAVVTYSGIPLLTYQPAIFEPAFFEPFFVGFNPPLIVTAACVFCPAPVVSWQQPVQSYADPIDLVGDLQITSAVQDGMADNAARIETASADDPALSELKAQVADMQPQIDAAVQGSTDLRSQLTDHGDGSATAGAAGSAFSVPDDVRQQIHQQVRENLELHKQELALTWPDIVASGEAPHYIFQVSDRIDATDDASEECLLNTGDLLRLNLGTEPDNKVLSMRVVTSSWGSCPAGSTISLSVRDAQQMLNDFSQRQELNMQRLQPEIASASRQ